MQLGAEEVEERLALDPEVATVPEGGEDVLEVRAIVVGSRIRLFDEHAIGLVVPDAAPGLIRPCETEGEIRLTCLQHLRVGALEDAPTREPVVPVAERLDAVRTGEGSLLFTGFGKTEIVETQVCRQVRLAVSAKERPGFRGIGPFREAGSPPVVVLRDRMKLGEVERENSRSPLVRLRFAHGPRMPGIVAPCAAGCGGLCYYGAVSGDEFSRRDIAYHEATASAYDADVTAVFEIYHRYLLDPFLDKVASTVGHGRALDLGCGTGVITVALAERGFDVVGVDHSPDMLAIAEEKLARAPAAGKHELMTADARDLPVGSAEFDCVTCQGLLHHLEDIRPCIAEIVRVLKPGGFLYVSEPCVNVTPLKRVGASIWHTLRPPQEVHEFDVPESVETPIDASELELALTHCGLRFEAVFLTHLEPLRFVLSDRNYLSLVRVASYPWRHSRGDLIFVFGRKLAAAGTAPT
jgi:SAM-dependent methyltransferase